MGEFHRVAIGRRILINLTEKKGNVMACDWCGRSCAGSYCSDRCRMEARAAREAYYNPPKVCAYCGAEYRGAGWEGCFCSIGCRDKYIEGHRPKHKCAWCGAVYNAEDGYKDVAGLDFCSKKCMHDADNDTELKAKRQAAIEKKRQAEEKRRIEEENRKRREEEKKRSEEAAARRTREFTQRAIEAFDAQQLDEAWECVKKASVSDLELNYRMVRASKGVGLEQYFDDNALHKLLPRLGKKAECDADAPMYEVLGLLYWKFARNGEYGRGGYKDILDACCCSYWSKTKSWNVDWRAAASWLDKAAEVDGEGAMLAGRFYGEASEWDFGVGKYDDDRVYWGKYKNSLKDKPSNREYPNLLACERCYRKAESFGVQAARKEYSEVLKKHKVRVKKCNTDRRCRLIAKRGPVYEWLFRLTACAAVALSWWRYAQTCGGDTMIGVKSALLLLVFSTLVDRNGKIGEKLHDVLESLNEKCEGNAAWFIGVPISVLTWLSYRSLFDIMGETSGILSWLPIAIASLYALSCVAEHSSYGDKSSDMKNVDFKFAYYMTFPLAAHMAMCKCGLFDGLGYQASLSYLMLMICVGYLFARGWTGGSRFSFITAPILGACVGIYLSPNYLVKVFPDAAQLTDAFKWIVLGVVFGGVLIAGLRSANREKQDNHCPGLRLFLSWVVIVVMFLMIGNR